MDFICQLLEISRWPVDQVWHWGYSHWKYCRQPDSKDAEYEQEGG